MTPAPPTEDQLLIVRRIADDSGLRRGNAIYALLADYARLKEDAARLEAVESGLTLECRAGVSVDRWMARNSVTGDYWTAPTARAVIDAARAKEGS